MNYSEFLRLLASFLATKLPKEAKLVGGNHICIDGSWNATTFFYERDNIFPTSLTVNQNMLLEWEAYECDADSTESMF